MNSIKTDLETLYNQKSQDIYRFIQKRVNNVDDVDEISQETWKKAFGAAHKVKKSKAILGYVLKIASNTIIDYYKKRDTSPHGSMRFPFEEKVFEKNTDTFFEERQQCPEATAIQREMLINVLKYVKGNFSTKQAKIFMLFIRGYSTEEIAERCSVTTDTVRSTVRAGRERLKSSKDFSEKEWPL